MAGYLSTLNAIKTALAQAASIIHVKNIRDKAEAIRVYTRQQADCRDIEREATVVRLRAERRLGELLAKSVRAGNPNCSPGGQLPAGITRKQSSNWQAIAKLPEAVFEKHLECRTPSTKRLVALVQEHQRNRQRRGPDSGSGILTGDNQQLWTHLKDGSVDLFLTDPPYAEVSAYAWLAKLAASKLKDGGLCLAYSGIYYLPQVLAAMGEHLTYHWIFAIAIPAPYHVIHPKKTQNAWVPIVAYSKGKPKHGYMIDRLWGGGRDKSMHEWQHPQSEAEYLIEKLTRPGELIVDPYCGSGTTGAAAKKLGRRWLGVEIDANIARGARRRLAA